MTKTSISPEHPYRSWIWYTKSMVALASRPGVYMAVFSNCCFGGQRQKWTSLLTNNRALFEAMRQPECEHGDWADYDPYFEGSRVVFPTEQEAEYPEGMCSAMAHACAQGVGLSEFLDSAHRQVRAEAIAAELQHYHRCQDDELRTKMAQEILEIEDKCIPGSELSHLEWLLARGHYYIRLTVEHCSAKHLIPYPAGRWLWKTLLSFRWKQDAHINILEAQAFFAQARRVLRQAGVRACRGGR